jgi:hypothetical protein
LSVTEVMPVPLDLCSCVCLLLSEKCFTKGWMHLIKTWIAWFQGKKIDSSRCHALT